MDGECFDAWQNIGEFVHRVLADSDKRHIRELDMTAEELYQLTAVVKVVLRSRGGSPDEARLEQTPYPFQPH